MNKTDAIFGFFFVLFFNCVFSVPSLLAQNNNSHFLSNNPIPQTIGKDISRSVCDARQIFSAPRRFGKKEWLTLGAVSLSTIALFSGDESIRTFSKKQHRKTMDDVMKVGRTYGNGMYAFLFSGGIYFGGLIFSHETIRMTGQEMIESLIFAGFITTSLKSILGRSRPYTEEGAFRFRGFQHKTRTTSFPSGHATVAFALSSVLVRRINIPLATFVLYGMEGITSLSRIYHDAHWASDVLLGSAIGTVIGTSVVSLHTVSQRKISYRVTPTINGLNFSVNF